MSKSFLPSFRGLLLVFAPSATIAFLSSCTTSGQPKALDTLYHDYEQSRVELYKARIQTFANSSIDDGVVDSKTRNQVMNDLILLIDHNYGRTERSLLARKSWADFGGSVVGTGLSTGATLASGESIKTTLSAIVTAIESTKVSFNKDVLYGQSMLAIVTQMHKQRAEKILDIRKSMKLGVEEYPLSYGLTDLLEYYNAGTFTAALQSMTEDAAAKKKTAESQLKDLKSSYVKDDTGDTLRKFWKPDGKTTNDKNETALKTWLEKEEITASIPFFIRSSQFASERKKAVAELINKETDE